MLEKNRHFSPAEAAHRLGVSVKALRVYERHGLVKPLRSHADWRAYGPDEMARLHQVLALKGLGLSLAKIDELLKGEASTLASVLALQEQILAAEGKRVEHALTLVRAARTMLASGEMLSIDDLATLTKETTMSTKPTPEEMKQIFDPLTQKHFTKEQLDALDKQPFDSAHTQKAWDDLITEAKAHMAKGDATSPAAIDLAKRWKHMVELFTKGNLEIDKRVRAMWQDAMADPIAAPKLPMNPELFAFIGKAMEALKNTG